MPKRRAGNARGRKGKDGIFSPHHNDRDTREQPEHIDPAKTPDNKIVLYGREEKKQKKVTIDQHEQEIYEDLFAEALEIQNDKHLKSRHKERIQTMEQARTKNERWCPEETIFSLGDSKTPIDSEIFWKIHQDFVDWHQKKYPQCVFLDSALHVDESYLHIHDRMVWTAIETAQDGHKYAIVSQQKALEQIGVERPDPAKKNGRHNNAKMTYTADCRQKQIEIARSYGLEIEDVPRDPSKSGLSFEKHVLQKIKEDQELQIEQNDAISDEIATKLWQIDVLDQAIAERQEQLAALDTVTAEQQEREIRHMELYERMTKQSAQYRDFMEQIAADREEMERGEYDD